MLHAMLRKLKEKKVNKKGFTMIELIIVVAIIAILAAILIPMFMNFRRNAAISAAEKEVQSVGTAYALAVVENGVAASVAPDRASVALQLGVTVPPDISITETGVSWTLSGGPADGETVAWDRTTGKLVPRP